MRPAFPAFAIILLGALLLPSDARSSRDEPAHVTLIGRAVLPAATFAPGPPSGRYGDATVRAASAPFASQPVQGISTIKPGTQANTWWALSDNGFATKWNSSDYRLALYLFRASPESRNVELLRRVELRDPQRQFPYRLTEETDVTRPLTGADMDPESLVVLDDGTFWIGDEFGPWLLHFSAEGELLEPPYESGESAAQPALRSVDHPRVLAGLASATVRASGGFEGLVLSVDGQHLLAMLEKPLPGAAEQHVPILEFSLEQRRFTGRRWLYPLERETHVVRELAQFSGTALLAIENDDLQGDAAAVKRIYRVDLAQPQAGGRLTKQLQVDLLSIHDPRGLGPQGPSAPFRFPFVTIEAVHALDARTLLVVNDNNFPSLGARGKGVPNDTEWIWLRLPKHP
jgi:hypothetical protein